MKMIKLKINGKNVVLENSLTIEEMILEKQISGSMFVIEKNREIIQKEDYAKTLVEDDDVLEIVGFFGGG